MTASARRFPDGFLFGAATAAYQIEGGAFEDGRTASIWDAFARVPGAVNNGDTGDVACDHYHRYRDDVRLMTELGLQAYRFSTSWARVRPDGGAVNQEGLAFYDRLVDELLAADSGEAGGNGIVPWLTLYHWDLPQALEEKGGWTSRDTVDRFVEYALSVHDVLGDRVQHWTTLNEPWCSSFLSYTAGVHAPGRTSVEDGILSAHHLLLAHGRTIEALRARDPELDLGITLNLTVADPADPADAGDVDAARRIDGQFNRWFLDPILRGAYPADVVDDIRAVDPIAVRRWANAIQAGDLDTIAAPLDCLGINYYHGEMLSGSPQPGGAGTPHDGEQGAVVRRTRSPFPAADDVHWVERGLPRTGMDWEVQPEGLTRLLCRIGTEYAPGLPLFVTENGAAYDDVIEGGQVHDAERAAFLREHIAATHDAIEEGVDVRGYFAWSLLDNYEWAFGYSKRFGIVRVDYDTQDRIVKDSGREYARIIAARAV
ncbi:GH1 family beta-glucosidase [Microbacterium sp. 22242]|uniref:GH1 family beta-glucosidase n=1 Tax=Microbacterium sp. 22242 TaxID=3453896 RepID=UPI003F847BF3